MYEINDKNTFGYRGRNNLYLFGNLDNQAQKALAATIQRQSNVYSTIDSARCPDSNLHYKINNLLKGGVEEPGIFKSDIVEIKKGTKPSSVLKFDIAALTNLESLKLKYKINKNFDTKYLKKGHLRRLALVKSLRNRGANKIEYKYLSAKDGNVEKIRLKGHLNFVEKLLTHIEAKAKSLTRIALV